MGLLGGFDSHTRTRLAWHTAFEIAGFRAEGFQFCFDSHTRKAGMAHDLGQGLGSLGLLGLLTQGLKFGIKVSGLNFKI